MPADTYTITIGATKDKTGIKATTGSVPTNLTTELNNASPNWATNLTTKSKKWTAGQSSDITAAIEVKPDGGVSITYSPTDFSTYMSAK